MRTSLREAWYDLRNVVGLWLLNRTLTVIPEDRYRSRSHLALCLEAWATEIRRRAGHAD